MNDTTTLARLGWQPFFQRQVPAEESTLQAARIVSEVQTTSEIRADDEKGRHTTTQRSLHLLAEGALLLDTPGMRELQLLPGELGLAETFDDIGELAKQCRFADCAHDQEPGCAVRAAVDSGALEARRLENYHKLLREQARSAATTAELREQARRTGRLHRWAGKAHERKREDK